MNRTLSRAEPIDTCGTRQDSHEPHTTHRAQGETMVRRILLVRQANPEASHMAGGVRRGSPGLLDAIPESESRP